MNAFKAAVQLAFRQAVGATAPTSAHVAVSVTFVLPRPKALIWKSRPMPRARHGHKPDAENLAKSLLDCLTGLAWVDDAQVSDLVIRKRIASGSEAAHADVAIRSIAPEPSTAEQRRAARASAPVGLPMDVPMPATVPEAPKW